MKFIQGIPRTQAVLFATCLDDAIEADNEVRLLDAMDVTEAQKKKFFQTNAETLFGIG